MKGALFIGSCFALVMPSFAHSNTLFPTLELSCPNKEIKNVYEIDPKMLPPSLNQDKTGTCYAHSAYYLLSHLLKERYGPEAQASIIDFYHRSCRSHTDLGGVPTAALMKNKLRTEKHIRAASGKESLYLLKSISNQLKNYQPSPEERYEVINELLENHQFDSPFTVDEIRLHTESQTNPTEREIAFKLANTMKSEKFEIPSYNVRRMDISSFHPERRDAYFFEIENVLKQVPPRPVNLDIDMDLLNPGGFHSITIIGMRDFCCYGFCRHEYNVKNSWGENVSEGWMDAEFIKNATQNASYLIPCKDAGCKKYILADDPVMVAMKTDSTEILNSTCKDTRISRDLRTKLNLGIYYIKLADSLNTVNNEKFSKILRKSGAEDLVASARGWNLLHRAAALGSRSEIEKILKHDPQAIHQGDGLGHSIADIALIRLHFDLVERLLKDGAKLNAPLGDALNYGLDTLFLAPANKERSKKMVKLFLKLHDAGHNLNRIEFKLGQMASVMSPLEFLSLSLELTQKLKKMKYGHQLLAALINDAGKISKSNSLISAFHLALESNNFQMAAEILSVPGMDVKVINSGSTTMVHDLVQPNAPKFLLERVVALGSNINNKNSTGITPLGQLIDSLGGYTRAGLESEFVDKFTMLVRAGADITFMGGKKSNLFKYLALHGYDERRFPVLGSLSRAARFGAEFKGKN